ncbi:uncharacterized protein LOC125760442 [Anopheles funestus]|nr:uncharacterized protein LOC125760442 [Anopheles funestus]
MRSATKSKMTKVQNYVREHGEDCPYKLNLVERLIWDTFSVKPEEYMKDLNMKLWREKQQANCHGVIGQQQSALDCISPSSSEISTEQSFDMGWNPEVTTCHNTGLGGNSEMCLTSVNKENGKLAYSNQTTGGFYAISSCNLQDQNYGEQPTTSSLSYQGFPSTDTNQWNGSGSSYEEREDASLHQAKMTSISDLVPGNKMLWELNKLFEVVLKQNEEILVLLRQSSNDN